MAEDYTAFQERVFGDLAELARQAEQRDAEREKSIRDLMAAFQKANPRLSDAKARNIAILALSAR